MQFCRFMPIYRIKLQPTKTSFLQFFTPNKGVKLQKRCLISCYMTESIKDNKDFGSASESNKQTSYALKRIVFGVLVGFVLTFVGGYFFACYKDNISVTIGLGIFRNPIIGMGLIGISFIGTIIGALAGMFSKK